MKVIYDIINMSYKSLEISDMQLLVDGCEVNESSMYDEDYIDYSRGDYMKLEEKLLQLRKENEFSQEALANQLNVTRQSVSKWESGQSLPDLDNLIRLSDIYGVSLDQLVKEDLSISSEPEAHAEKKLYDEDRGAIVVFMLMVALASLGCVWGIFTGNFLMALIGALVGLAIGLILNVLKLIK